MTTLKLLTIGLNQSKLLMLIILSRLKK